MVAGDLRINANAALPNLNGLSDLSQVGKSLYIGNNAVLENLDGLLHLQGIGEGERDLMIVELNPVLPEYTAYALAERLGLTEHRYIVFNNRVEPNLD